MVRRNAGRNLSKSVPMAKPMPDLGKIAYQWEKDLITDQERLKYFNQGFEQGIFTALAVTFKVMLFHYHELKYLRHRLPTFEMYFNKFFESIDKPDLEQQFAEWYYEETTGFEFLRKEYETMANKESKIKIGEIVDRYIAEAGKTRAEVATAINKGPKVLNALRAGNVSKKVIDAIMEHLGKSFSSGEAAVYRDAYGIGNNDTARFEKIEAELLQRDELREETKLADIIETADIPKEIQEVLEEQLPQVLAEANTEPLELVIEEPASIPVPEELPGLIEAVTAAEELPLSDANEMYKEAVPEPNIIDGLCGQVQKYKAEYNCIDADIEELSRQIEAKKERKHQLNAAIDALNVSINIIKEAGV